MSATPKWNEELPLRPKARLAPPRRYEITLDGKPSMVTIAQKPFSTPMALPLARKHFSEIQGASLREDELREDANENGPRELIIDSRGRIHRPHEVGFPTYIGTQTIAALPPGRVITREKLRNMMRLGLIKKHKNRVNAFPSGKILPRKKPFNPRLLKRALALSNPGAYHGMTISPRAATVSASFLGHALANGRVTIGRNSTVYRRTRMGWSPIGTIKKAGRGVARGAKAVGRGAARGARTVGRGITRGASAVASVTKDIGKMSVRGLGQLAVLISSAAATPIRVAFKTTISTPRANALARSRGRRSPNAQDKRDAIAWGFKKLKQKMPIKLGDLTVLILRHTKGVSLAGTEMGLDPATISIYAGAVTSGILALKTVLDFTEGLKKGDVSKMARSVQEFQATLPGTSTAMPPGYIPGQMPSSSPEQYYTDAEASFDIEASANFEG